MSKLWVPIARNTHMNYKSPISYGPKVTIKASFQNEYIDKKVLSQGKHM